MVACDSLQCALLQTQMQAVVKTNATVVIGYCFGAAAILDLAASWPDAITDNVLGERVCECCLMVCALLLPWASM